jgi:membrane fusion protein, multidrug efflux system
VVLSRGLCALKSDGVQAAGGKGLIVSERGRSSRKRELLPERLYYIQGSATGGLSASADPHWRTSRQWHPKNRIYTTILESVLGFWGRTLRPALLVCGAALVVAAAASCSGSKAEEAPKKGEAKAVPVSVATAAVKSIPIELKTFGSVETMSAVTVRLEITGTLTHVHFQKGQDVQKGDLLFTIDPRPYDAALKQAEAVLAKDKAMAKNAVAEAERQKALVDKGILSPSEYEKSRADADALAATLQADEAAIDTAKIQLDHCTIRSPVSGRVGNLLVTEGNLVKLTDMPMAVINQISPIEVFFAISQSELALLRRQQSQGQGKMKVAVMLPDDPGRPEIGQLSFVDNTLDKTSGMVQLAATFENKEQRLWPGQYVAVVLSVGEIKEAVTVPSQAIQNGRDSKYVMVVKADGTAEMRPVTVGLTFSGDTIVTKGLAAAEVVVTDGHVRLKAGDRTEIKPAVKTPTAGSTPKAAPDKAAPEQAEVGARHALPPQTGDAEKAAPGKAAPEKAAAEKASPGGGA